MSEDAKLHLIISPPADKRIFMAVCVFIQDVFKPVRARYMGRAEIDDVPMGGYDVAVEDF